MSEIFEVTKWGYSVQLADGTCHCGRPIKYNLCGGVIGHVDPDANAVCAEPWPDVPAPERYAASRAVAAELQRAGEVLDQALGVQPTVSAPALGLEPCEVEDQQDADVRRALSAMQTFDPGERAEEPHHAAARLRTDDERAALSGVMSASAIRTALGFGTGASR